jgi:hypothetical protein
MPRSTRSRRNADKANEIFQNGGKRAIYDAVDGGELICDGRRWCEPCGGITPGNDGVCLVCGTILWENDDANG